MAHEKPRNWDWVKATGECSPVVVFDELKSLAQRDVQTRNQQMNVERFDLADINGVQFAVGRDANINTRIYFTVTDDLNRISVKAHGGQEMAVYTIGLDESGACRFKKDGEWWDPWQVLQAALEPTLFA